ncbi:DUF3466 family protein [Pseudoduganella aquatica]|uniref:DUF3466 family protein n=1 Tax=Pseudoduganella aquatica TaxID=2660641 RepID=UPI001E34E3DD|nr:DUF3466 family protein [Pseudoduganella aquatica]
MVFRFHALPALLMLALAGAAAATPQYRLTLLDPAPNASSANAINSRGEIAGDWRDPLTGVQRAFAWRSGQMSVLPEPMATARAISGQGHIAGATNTVTVEGFTFRNATLYYQGELRTVPNPFSADPQGAPPFEVNTAVGVNSAGTVVGNAGANRRTSAYLFANQALTVLPMMWSSAINEQGQVAGRTFFGNSEHAALYDGARVIDLGALEQGRFSNASDLNDHGWVVGSSTYGTGPGQHTHSFVYRNGQMQAIGDWLTDNQANAVNNDGAVVGTVQGPSGQGSPYLYQGGLVYDLNTLLGPDPALRLVSAADINDAGQIIGQACDTAGACFAALLTPVPEPAAWGMLAAGLGVLAWLRRPRRPRPRLSRCAAAILLGGAGACAMASPARYSLTLLDGVARASVPRAINNAGVVVGGMSSDYGQMLGEGRAFMWKAGQMTWLPELDMSMALAVSERGHVAGIGQLTSVGPGWFELHAASYYEGKAGAVPEAFPGDPARPSGYTAAQGVNSSGTLLVNSHRPGGDHAYTYAGGVITVLPMDTAAAINDAGQVAGASGGRAVLYDRGRVIDLGLLSSAPSAVAVARGMNEAGAVVGGATYGGGALHQHSFLYEGGRMRAIGSLEGDNAAVAVNNRGDVVGYFSKAGDGPADRHSYLYSGGVQSDLDALLADAPGWHIASAADINDGGQIVGLACRNGDLCYSALLSPVPEPASWGMLAAGMGAVALARGRLRQRGG